MLLLPTLILSMGPTVLYCKSCTQPLDAITGLQLHPTCDVDPNITVNELFDMVETSILNQPRSLQRTIGPSEIGVPCDRRLGYQLAGIPEINKRGVAWKPYVGTALHEMFADIMGKAEIARFTDEDTPRWHVEERVTVGEIGGKKITGSCDLFDEHMGLVVDWKTTSKNQIRQNLSRNGASQQYRVQANLYGKGFEDAGYQVRDVALAFLTRDGEWEDRYIWSEPYDRSVAENALARANAIHTAIEALGGTVALERLATADVYCRNCPFYRPRSKNAVEGCTGHGTNDSSTPAGDK